jgi:hypothetical protein
MITERMRECNNRAGGRLLRLTTSAQRYYHAVKTQINQIEKRMRTGG